MFKNVNIIHMDTSVIIFAGIVVCGIAGIPLIFRSVHKLIKEFLQYQEKQENKKQKEKIDEIKSQLNDVVNSGSLTDLINTTKKLGDNRRK